MREMLRHKTQELRTPSKEPYIAAIFDFLAPLLSFRKQSPSALRASGMGLCILFFLSFTDPTMCQITDETTASASSSSTSLQLVTADLPYSSMTPFSFEVSIESVRYIYYSNFLRS